MENKKNMLKGGNLRIIGLGNFGKKVLFLQLETSENVREFAKLMREKLASYRVEDDHKNFSPHLTLARIHGRISFEKWQKIIMNTREIAKSIDWQFEISEIVLYGVDPRNNQKGQQRLVTCDIS